MPHANAVTTMTQMGAQRKGHLAQLRVRGGLTEETFLTFVQSFDQIFSKDYQYFKLRDDLLVYVINIIYT